MELNSPVTLEFEVKVPYKKPEDFLKEVSKFITILAWVEASHVVINERYR